MICRLRGNSLHHRPQLLRRVLHQVVHLLGRGAGRVVQPVVQACVSRPLPFAQDPVGVHYALHAHGYAGDQRDNAGHVHEMLKRPRLLRKNGVLGLVAQPQGQVVQGIVHAGLLQEPPPPVGGALQEGAGHGAQQKISKQEDRQQPVRVHGLLQPRLAAFQQAVDQVHRVGQELLSPVVDRDPCVGKPCRGPAPNLFPPGGTLRRCLRHHRVLRQLQRRKGRGADAELCRPVIQPVDGGILHHGRFQRGDKCVFLAVIILRRHPCVHRNEAAFAVWMHRRNQVADGNQLRGGKQRSVMRLTGIAGVFT